MLQHLTDMARDRPYTQMHKDSEDIPIRRGNTTLYIAHPSTTTHSAHH